MKLKIGFLETSDLFILSPIDFELKKLRGLKVYLKYLNDGTVSENQIIIPVLDSDILDLYHRIKELFAERFGCTLEQDEVAGSTLSLAESEEKNFELFSQKARSIRNNEILKEELYEFLEIVRSESFKRTLKPFQLLAAYHLAFSQNACNFSVPGSGKTTTVLAAYAYLKKTPNLDKKVQKLVVLGPLASFLAWKKEYLYCFGKPPCVLEITGNSKDAQVEGALLKRDVAEDLILISYDSVFRRMDVLTSFLQKNASMVVLDEAHRIKNVEDGKRSTATLQLAPFARSRVVLTGTPAPNSFVDLYNLYKFIWPSHNVIGYSIPQLANMSKGEDARVNDLISRISPFFIRVKKSDLGLPNPTFWDPIQVVMKPVQDKIYDAIAKMAIGKLEKGAQSTVSRLSAIIRLRQAASNPTLLNSGLEDYYSSIGDETHRIKLDSNLNVDDSIKDLIRQYEYLETPHKFIKAGEIAEKIISKGERLVVWCEFIGNCDALSEYFKSIGIENRILYGNTSLEDRDSIIEEFTNTEIPSSFSVVIANPHAVGESISLHMTCHNALYLELSFNAGTYMQSKDRIHRVGLEKNTKTNYYYLHSEGTIDEAIFSRVTYKEKRMLDLIENQEIPLLFDNQDFQEDNEDDIKAIIRGYYEYRNKHL